MSSPISWRTYTVVLTHLRSSTQPPAVIQSLLAHHLAAPPTPTPTPLAAASVSSPYFLATPYSYEHLQAFETAYRQAVHLCWKGLEAGLLTPSKQTQLLQWVSWVLSGLKNGNALLRLAACAGLLLGLQDMEAKTELSFSGRTRSKLEDEAVMALAECLDLYSAEWAKEHDSIYGQASSDPLFLSLILASHIFSQIPRRKLAALPLDSISNLLACSIWQAFRGGRVFSQFLNTVMVDNAGRVELLPSEIAAASLKVTADPLYGALPSLCRFLSLTLTMPLSTSKADLAPARSVLNIFDEIAAHADLLSLLDSKSNNEITQSAQPVITDFFAIVKTLLFCIVMVADAVMAHVVYVRPEAAVASSAASPTPSTTFTAPSSPHIALSFTLLRTLARLSPAKATFPELARAFYAALDVIAADARGAVDALVRGIARGDTIGGVARADGVGAHASSFVGQMAPSSPSRVAFALSCIEQLVPVLGLGAVEEAWSFVAQHLSSPSPRAPYEAAHSAALALFDAYAPAEGDVNKREEKAQQIAYVARLVPYYAQCLIENSSPSHLSLAQLRHAYVMVVRCAGSHDDVLALYCVQALMDALKGRAEGDDGTVKLDAAHKQRLRLTLASTISSVPISLLPKVLDELKNLATRSSDGPTATTFTIEERVALRDAIFEEITEKVGNAGKEFAVRWWYANRGVFPPVGLQKGKDVDGKGKGKEEDKLLAQL